MNKLELLQFLEGVPDEMELVIDTEIGILPICVGDSDFEDIDLEGNQVFALRPCYCAINEIELSELDKSVKPFEVTAQQLN